jgi:hypothetical protein
MKWSELSIDDLPKLAGQGTHHGAMAAWNRVEEIQAKGGSPAVFFSKFNDGFTVLDENDPEQFKRAMSIRSQM